jgi:hypothetical protein
MKSSKCWRPTKFFAFVQILSRDVISPSHWFQRAAQTRAKAQRTRDAVTRDRLIQMAEEYDRLAEQAERQLTSLDAPAERKPL